jgi:hypothetical protein
MNLVPPPLHPLPPREGRFWGCFGIFLLVTTFLYLGTGLVELQEAIGQTKTKTGQSYGRNPFLLPSGLRVPKVADPIAVKQEKAEKFEIRPVEASPSPLKVKAILIGEHVRLASIDRQIVTIGDRILEERVIEIKSDRVVLERGNQKRTLFLSQSPIRLSVEERW